MWIPPTDLWCYPVEFPHRIATMSRVGWGGVDVTVMRISMQTWCYAVENSSGVSYTLVLRCRHLLQTFYTSSCYAVCVFSRLSYIFDAARVPLMQPGSCAKALFRILWVLNTETTSYTAKCGSGSTRFTTKMRRIKMLKFQSWKARPKRTKKTPIQNYVQTCISLWQILYHSSW